MTGNCHIVAIWASIFASRRFSRALPGPGSAADKQVLGCRAAAGLAPLQPGSEPPGRRYGHDVLDSRPGIVGTEPISGCPAPGRSQPCRAHGGAHGRHHGGRQHGGGRRRARSGRQFRISALRVWVPGASPGFTAAGPGPRRAAIVPTAAAVVTRPPRPIAPTRLGACGSLSITSSCTAASVTRPFTHGRRRQRSGWRVDAAAVAKVERGEPGEGPCSSRGQGRRARRRRERSRPADPGWRGRLGCPMAASLP